MTRGQVVPYRPKGRVQSLRVGSLVDDKTSDLIGEEGLAPASEREPFPALRDQDELSGRYPATGAVRRAGGGRRRSRIAGFGRRLVGAVYAKR